MASQKLTDVWRSLVKCGDYQNTYDSLRLLLRKNSFDYSNGVNETGYREILEIINNSVAPGHGVRPSLHDVIKTLSNLADSNGKVSGQIILIHCQLHNLCSAATIYSRSRSNKIQFSSRGLYSPMILISLLKK